MGQREWFGIANLHGTLLHIQESQCSVGVIVTYGLLCRLQQWLTWYHCRLEGFYRFHMISSQVNSILIWGGYLSLLFASIVNFFAMLLASFLVFFSSLCCCLFYSGWPPPYHPYTSSSKISCIIQPPGLLPLSCLVIRAVTFKSLTRFPSCILAGGLKGI